MKLIVVLAVALAGVTADVAQDDKTVPIVRSSYDISPEGGYEYAYETGNGIYGQATGELKNTNAEYPTLAVKGSYKYIAPDGTPIEVIYVSDEAGYRPQGSHLPEPPPTPEAILRSLAYIAAHPPKVESPAKPTFG